MKTCPHCGGSLRVAQTAKIAPAQRPFYICSGGHTVHANGDVWRDGRRIA